jgi:hypothetical protein
LTLTKLKRFKTTSLFSPEKLLKEMAQLMADYQFSLNVIGFF